MGVSRGATIEEIGQVYEQRFANFLRTATAIADSTEEGRDAVHDAFVSAVRSRKSYRGSGSVEAWLWRTVVTSALKRRRSGRRTAATDSAPQDAIWTESPAGEYPEIRAAVAGLPERQRHVLFLRYYADLDYRSIAAALDIEVGTVSAALAAAHTTVRKAFEEVQSHG